MDRLPPTVTDEDLLALLGRMLETNPTVQSTSELRLQSFQHGFSWQALVDLAVAHDVLPPLIWALNQRSLLPPVPVKLAEEARAAHVTSRLSAAYGDHLRRQADLRDQLIAALAALNAEGIVPLLLKGAVHLTLPQSEWHAARAMRDIDMLVAAKQATRANAILLSLGYRADPNPPPLDRHLPELHLPTRAGTIELHTEALSFPARYALNTAEVFARAQNRSIGSVNFQVVPPEWHLLHGLLHHQLADRGHARRILSIKGLWEFARVRRWGEFRWMELHRRACRVPQNSRHAVELGGAGEPAVRARSPGNAVASSGRTETCGRHLQTRVRAI